MERKRAYIHRAERFAAYDGKPQGCRCIFAELPPPRRVKGQSLLIE